MDREMDTYHWNGLPRTIEGVLGEVKEVRQEMPGVSYVRAVDPAAFVGREYYIVDETAEVSKPARAFGQGVQGHPGLLQYSADDMRGGQAVIEYEICRYKILHGIPLPEGVDLRTLAVYGAELFPEYFGYYLVPAVTPWGRTTRHKTIANGVYWLETERGIQGMSVSFPLYDDLSDTARGLAEQEGSRPKGKTGGVVDCLFFSRTASCIPLFELLDQEASALQLLCPIDKAALMNAIYQSYPEYVVQYNRTEQVGGHDTFGLLMNALGVKEDLAGSAEHMISLSVQAGTEFLAF